MCMCMCVYVCVCACVCVCARARVRVVWPSLSLSLSLNLYTYTQNLFPLLVSHIKNLDTVRIFFNALLKILKSQGDGHFAERILMILDFRELLAAQKLFEHIFIFTADTKQVVTV